MLEFQDANASYYEYQEYLQTQIKHITSRSLASRVAVAAGLDREVAPGKPQPREEGLMSRWAWIWGGGRNPRRRNGLFTREERLQQGIDEVLGGLTVTPERNSRVVEIAYSSPDPKQAARLANILTQEYIEYNFQAKYDATSRATDFLQKQLVDLKAKVEKSEEAQIEYARGHNIMAVGEKQDVVTQTLADVNTKLTEARSVRMDKESVYRNLSDATTEDFPQALRTPQIESRSRATCSPTSRTWRSSRRSSVQRCRR